MSESNDNSKIIELPFSEVKPEHLGQELAPIEDPDVVSTEIAAPKKKKKGDDAPLKKTTIGGQALIEGVMMVGPSRTCMAVRKGDGTIYVEEIKQGEKTSYFEKVPFVRGCIRFYKMLVTGTGALMKAADISEEGKPDPKKEGEKKSRLDEFTDRHFNIMMLHGKLKSTRKSRWSMKATARCMRNTPSAIWTPFWPITRCARGCGRFLSAWALMAVLAVSTLE